MNLILNNTPTLCLNMIVKNEGKIISRLLKSVASIIDCYCICDTGSTDDTINIIVDYFKGTGIRGKIVQEPFKNFCDTRNVALQYCMGMSDYVLLLDADMVLEIKTFNKNTLASADSFQILQGNDSFYYQNMRIIKNNGLYKYVGVTHEYIDTPQNNTSLNIEKNNLFIRDIGDGGSKSDKFERDIRLLLDGIKKEPNNVRYYFYLANSYHDSGRFCEAINVYKKRIELGGWIEEVWYSYYRIGLCFKNIGKMNDAIEWWLKGYEYYPERLEGLYEILNYYRVKGSHTFFSMIYQDAKKILNLKKKRDNYLFLHNDIYTWKIYYEYTIMAYYMEIRNINDEFIQILNNAKYESEINNLIQNFKFYKDVLNEKSRIILDNKMKSSVNDEVVVFNSSSSCLIPNKDNNNAGYKMNVRYVNYTIDENGGYLNCDKHIISINKYIELDTNFEVKEEKCMQLTFDNRRYIGIEDIKIFNDVETNDLLFIGTGYHKSEKIGIVSGAYDTNSLTFCENELKTDFNNSYCEKNWVYVDYNDSTHIIYEWFPLKICKAKKETISLMETREMPQIFSRIRGSTCGFKYSKKTGENNNGNIQIEMYEDEIWFVTHMVSYESPRHYYHLIVIFDTQLNLLRYSAPFKFEGEPIEYCLSILVEDERVLINYSTWDRTTIIGVYDKTYIDSIVKYTP